MTDLINMLGILIAAGAVYGGIRADLKNMKQQIQQRADEINDLRARFDSHIDRRTTS